MKHDKAPKHIHHFSEANCATMKNPFKKGASWGANKNSSENLTEEVKKSPFDKPLPAGSTIPRATPFGDVAETIEEHGVDSPEAIHARAKVKDSYVPLPHSYWNVDPTTFELRVGPNYSKHKKKAPSGPSLYNLYSMDIVRAESTLDDITEGFEVPCVPGVTDVTTGHDSVPPLFVLICNIPAEEPDMLKPVSDGQTYVVVMYYIISPAMLAELEVFENSGPAVKLFAEWCEKAESDAEFRGRFKAMCVLDDIEKLGLPNFISGYNGKPALINKSGTFTRYENYIEMRINVHKFAFLPKKCLFSLHKSFPTFVLNVGFTIEARSDKEMPEVLLGGSRIINLDLGKVVPSRMTSDV